MASLSPLAEHLIGAANLRSVFYADEAMQVLVDALNTLGYGDVSLVHFDVAITGGQSRTPYRREGREAVALLYKKQLYDLHGKGAKQIAQRVAARYFPGCTTLDVKVLGKPRPARPITVSSFWPAHEARHLLLQVGQAWISEQQARALQGQTRQPEPGDSPRRSRL